MSKGEEEYYWAGQRKKVVLMWLCLLCKTVCIAAAWLPGQRIPVDVTAGWGCCLCTAAFQSLTPPCVCGEKMDVCAVG